MGRLSRFQIRIIKLGFISANGIIALYLLVGSLALEINTGRKFYNSVKEIAKETTFWELHPTYISLFMIMAIFMLVDFFVEFKKGLHKLAAGIIILLLLGTVVLLSSRIALICLLLAGLIYIRRKRGKLIYGLLISGFILAMVTFVEPLKFQVNEILETELELPTEKFPSTVKVRYAINYCSWQSIRDHMAFGVGIGGFQGELESCYSSLPTEALSRENYNSHNFYFFLWGSAGLLALVAFLFLLTHKLSNAILQKNRIQVIFWMIIFLANLTESILTRSFGIMFFVFFLSLFYIENNNEPSFDSHSGF
jgi:O-antigen ligase